MLLTEIEPKPIVEPETDKQPLDYESLRKKAGGQKPLCPFVVEIADSRQDPYIAPNYQTYEVAYHTDNVVAVSADGYKLENKRHGKVYALSSDAEKEQFRDIMTDYHLCLQELGEEIGKYPRCSDSPIPEGTEYVAQCPIFGQKTFNWLDPFVERFRLLEVNKTTLKVEPLVEEFDEEGNKKDLSQRIGKGAAIVVSDEDWERISELYRQCVCQSEMLQAFLENAGTYEDLVCSNYADISYFQAQVNSLKAKIKSTKSNLKAATSTKATTSFNEQLRKLEKELESAEGKLEIIENGNWNLVRKESEKAPDSKNFTWIICSDDAEQIKGAIGQASDEQLIYVWQCVNKPFHPVAKKKRVEFLKAEILKRGLNIECDNSICAAESALASPIRESNLNGNSLELPKSTPSAATSSPSDFQESAITETSESSPKPSETIASQEESTCLPHRPLASPSPSEESDSESVTSEIASPKSSTSSDCSNLNGGSSKMFLASSPAPTTPRSTPEATLDGCSDASMPAGTMSNGKLSPAPTSERPGVESDSLLLASPTALSSNGDGKPPGQMKLEADLRQMGAIGPREVANPEFLESGSGIPLGWTNPQDERSALEFLQEMESSETEEKPLATHSIQESDSVGLEGLSNSVQELKVLSLRQPWASLTVIINPETGKPFKGWETRGEKMKTNYRGKLIIHAAQKEDKSLELIHRSICEDLGIDLNFDDLPRGCAIGICDLTDCIQMTEEFIEEQPPDEIICGNWEVGRYAWKLENMQVFDTPIPMKGRQGLWNVDPEIFNGKLGELSYFETEAVAVEVVEEEEIDFYDDLDEEDAENLRLDASEIRCGMNSLWETTVRLAEISERAQERCKAIDKKKELSRGTTYNAWVAREFQGEGQKLAYAKQELERHRRVVRAFDAVPGEVMNKIVPGARLMLASDNYEAAREEAIALARCGTEITIKLAKDLIAELPTSHKPKREKPQPALPPERFSGEITRSVGRTYTQEELEQEVEERLGLAVKEYLQNKANRAWLKETLEAEVNEEVAEEIEAKVSIQQKLQKLKTEIGNLKRENSDLYTQNLRLKASELAQKVEQLEAEKDQLRKQLLAKREEAFKGGEFTDAAVRAIGKVFQGQEQATLESFLQQVEEQDIENRRLQLENEQLKAKLAQLQKGEISKNASAVANSPQLELVTNASTVETQPQKMPIGA